MHRAELYNMDMCVAAALESAGAGTFTAENLLEKIDRSIENLDYWALQEAFRDVCSLKRRMGFEEADGRRQ